MVETLRPDLCVLGDSAAGLHAAFLAAAFGVPVVLVTGRNPGLAPQRDRMLALYALRAVAQTAATIRHAPSRGLDATLATIDRPHILDHVRRIEEMTAPRDGLARFRALGVRVVESAARFDNPTTLRTDSSLITARRFIIADAPVAQAPIPNALDEINCLTFDQVLDGDDIPNALTILGGDARAMALAQALARLDVVTHVIADGDLLPRDDPEMTAIISHALQRDGVTFHSGTTVQSVTRVASDRLRLGLANGAIVETRAVLLSQPMGRDLDDLGLAAAGIGSHAGGICVDHRLRTDNKAIFAIGPVAALLSSDTVHSGRAQAECVIKQVLFRLPVGFEPLAMPRVVATAPELATIGLTEAGARARAGSISVLRSPFAGNDRARADHQSGGHAKILLDRRGRLLGASLVGSDASSLIAPWTSCLGRKPEALRRAQAPYPSLAETPNRALAESYAPLARSRLIRMTSAFLRWWG